MDIRSLLNGDDDLPALSPALSLDTSPAYSVFLASPADALSGTESMLPSSTLPPLPTQHSLMHPQLSGDHSAAAGGLLALKEASGDRLTFKEIVQLSCNPPSASTTHLPSLVDIHDHRDSDRANAGRQRRSSRESSLSQQSPKISASASPTVGSPSPLNIRISKIISNSSSQNDKHSGDRKYVCPFYGKPKTKKIRQIHASAHLFANLDALQEPEEICFARFRRRQEMERHVLSVHGSEQDKSWVCPGRDGRPCGKRYARADALRKHLDSARSKSGPDGCSFGLSDVEIAGLVKMGRSIVP